MISFKVTPGSKKLEIKKISETQYEIKLNARTEKGHANAQLIDVIADYFKVKKAAVKILHGHKTRNKVVETGD